MKKTMLSVAVIVNLRNKLNKINIVESDLDQPKTPSKDNQDLFPKNKSRLSNNSNVLYSNNFEYCNYGTSHSHSSQKERNYKGNNIHSRSFNQSNINDSKQTLYLNKRDNLSDKQQLVSINNTIVNTQLPNPSAIQFRNLNQLNYVPIIFNSAEQKSLERINKNNGVNNISNAYKKYPK